MFYFHPGRAESILASFIRASLNVPADTLRSIGIDPDQVVSIALTPIEIECWATIQAYVTLKRKQRRLKLISEPDKAQTGIAVKPLPREHTARIQAAFSRAVRQIPRAALTILDTTPEALARKALTPWDCECWAVMEASSELKAQLERLGYVAGLHDQHDAAALLRRQTAMLAIALYSEPNHHDPATNDTA